ncbi:type I secretion system permease/ATPase [Paracoccaceae bacterium Fryx2]|nr:type I secretion system permease/ATPase [Paracoccaceae bacterium Fryx2]
MKTRTVFDGQRGLIASIFIASMFVNLLILTAPLYMLQLFSRVMTSGSIPTLIALTVGAVLALLFFFAFDLIRQRLAARLGTRLETALGARVLEGLVDDVPTREAVGAQPVRDLQEVRAFASGPFFIALLDAPWSLVFVAVIYLFHPVLGMIALGGVLLLFLIGVMTEAFGRSPNRSAADAAQKANRAAEEILRNADIVRAMGQTPAMVDRWQVHSFGSMVFGTMATDRVAFLGALAKLVRMGLQIAILGVGVLLVLRDELTPGLMMAASILLGRAAAPVEQSISGWRALMSVRLSIQRLNTLLARQETRQALLELPEPLGHLTVEEATVLMADHQNPIVFGVSFDLQPGASLGIIGPSGAGKTTLARALVGLQPLSRGHVRIDDAALPDWPADQIGRYVGFLPQRVELFNGTVAENIAMMDAEAAPSAIVEAARRAEVHDLILTLPNGYNTPVGVLGERLSAGQRQRIGLARAFFGNRRLIVLDEPNANLDPEGEEALARAVANATARGAVVIVVTHRMSILRRVSHAAVMEGGRMIRFGPAREILDATLHPVAQQRVTPGKVTLLRRQGAAGAGFSSVRKGAGQ